MTISKDINKREISFLEKLSKNGTLNRIKIIGKYTHSMEPIECLCLIHNKQFTTIARNLLEGRGYCEECKKEINYKLGHKTKSSLLKTHEQFLEELKNNGFLNKY